MSMMHLVLYTIFTERREHGHKGSGPSHHYTDKVRYGRSNEHEGYGPLHCIYRDKVRYGRSDEHEGYGPLHCIYRDEVRYGQNDEHEGYGPLHCIYRDKVRYGRSDEHEGYGPLHCIYRDEVRYGQSDEHDQVPRLGHTSTWLWAASLVGAAEQCDRDGRSMPV